MISLDVNPKILVVGDLMVDHYLWGSCSRVSPEAPVQIIDIDHDNSVLGGAGNVLKNLKALGAQADVISVIGDCPIAYELKMLTEEIQIKSDYIFTICMVHKNRIQGAKYRGKNLITGSNYALCLTILDVFILPSVVRCSVSSWPHSTHCLIPITSSSLEQAHILQLLKNKL